MRHCSMLIAVLLVLPGCASDPEVEPTPVTRLPLDPTEPADTVGWWSNGTRLLHLFEDERFALYDGLNRYQDPMHVGRWSVGSYAVLWMEPYRTRQHQRWRVGLRRHEGEILLDLPNEPPMVKLDEPPGVLEDRLIGTWTGADGALELDPSLGFVLRRSAESTAAGCRGRWWLDGTTVRLEPIANVPPAWSLDVHTDGSAMSLRRDGETMWRRQQ